VSLTLRASRPLTIHIFPPRWEETFASEYNDARSRKGSPIPASAAIEINVKKGQEFVVDVRGRRPLISDIVRIVPDPGMTDEEKESPRSICAVDVTVSIGSKSFDGIVLSYDQNPVILYDDRDVKYVKKRTQ
jgi:hypothetical protein